MNVRRVAERLGISNANQLAAVAEIGLTTAYKLWSDRGVDMISMDTLSRLCKGLGTHPAALFEYEPEGDETGADLLERIKRAQEMKRGRPPKLGKQARKK